MELKRIRVSRPYVEGEETILLNLSRVVEIREREDGHYEIMTDLVGEEKKTYEGTEYRYLRYRITKDEKNRVFG